MQLYHHANFCRTQRDRPSAYSYTNTVLVVVTTDRGRCRNFQHHCTLSLLEICPDGTANATFS